MPNFIDSDEESQTGETRGEPSDRRKKHSKKGKKRKARDVIDSSEEEEDDNEEDDEDEDDSGKKKKKKKKTGLAAFILDEAEVDDDGNEDEDYDGEEFDDLIDRDKRSEVDAAAKEINHDMSNHRRLQMMWENKKEEEIEDYYRRKYAEQSEAERSSYRHGDSEELNEEITQAALMPTVKDPNLWMVKCQIGTEKITVLQLMRKFIAYEKTAEPLQIKSVIAPDAVKGFIYIEAYKQTHVKQAIDGITNLRLGIHRQALVPINEMTDVLRVVKEQPKLRPNQYVRLKRTIYKDDLAQVDYVDTAANQVHLRLKPRIDMTRKRGALKVNADKDQGRKSKFKRPPQKLFDADAIRAIGGEVSKDGDFDVFEGNRFKRGMLYKTFPMDAIKVEGVKPTLSELESTEQQSIHDAELQLGAEKETKFAPGDKVEVAEGELIHLQGRVLTVDGSRVTIMPKHEELTDPLQFPANELRKCFDEGDHVKVIDGRYEGDTGTIVSVEEKSAVLISDVSMDEIKVLIRDLQLCPDRATGVDTLGHFNWGDLVQIDPQSVGVIVRLEKENLQILTQHNKVRQFKSQSVTKRTDANRKAIALDKETNPIQVKDQVQVVDGTYKDKTAEVKHIFRAWVFLHSRSVLEHGGMFVCKAKYLKVVGSASNRKNVISGFSNPNMSAGLMSPRISSPHHPAEGRDATGHLMPSNPYGGRDRGTLSLIGKTIKIVKGSYKGHIGIVKDAIGSNARVELHSDCRTITVSMQNIKPADGGNMPDTHLMYATRSTPSYGSQTPSHGSRTPSHGLQTPMHDGSATPMHSMHDTTQTPRADFDIEEASSPKPPPSYATPATPSYHLPETPNAAYTPQTPGIYSSADYNSYSPYPVNSPAPGQYPGAQVQSPAPGAYIAPSPGYHGPSSAAPFNSYSTMTPGSMMNHQPQTPGAALEISHDWQMPDLVVSIKSSRSDPSNKNSLAGQTGYITSVSGHVTNVFLPQEDRCVSVSSSDLAPVEPKPGDKYKVIDGPELRDTIGTVISQDGPESVCMCDSSGVTGVTLLPVTVLCKLKPE